MTKHRGNIINPPQEKSKVCDKPAVGDDEIEMGAEDQAIPDIYDFPKAKGTIVSPHDIFRSRLRMGKMFRIGVPGGMKYKYDGKIFNTGVLVVFWTALESQFFLIQMLWLLATILLFTLLPYNETTIHAALPLYVEPLVRSLCVFTLTFYVGQVYSKWNKRLETVLHTHGSVKRLTGVAVGALPRNIAHTVIRYVNAIVRMNYCTNSSSGLCEGRWDALVKSGILEAKEVELLKGQGSPALIVHSWAIKVLRKYALSQGGVNTQPIESAIENCLNGAAGQSGKQIAYTLTQVPHLYYCAVSTLVNTSVFLSTYNNFGALTWLIHINFNCESIPLSSPFDISPDGKCKIGLCMAFLGQFIIILTFSALFSAALAMSECYGEEPFHYDLGYNLDGNWKEALDLLESMDRELPEAVRRIDIDVPLE
jgi:hypothetical protein